MRDVRGPGRASPTGGTRGSAARSGPWGARSWMDCVRSHGGSSLELAAAAAGCLGDLGKVITDLPRASEHAVLAAGAGAALLGAMRAHAGHAGARGLESEALRVIGRAAAAGQSDVLGAAAVTPVLATMCVGRGVRVSVCAGVCVCVCV